MAYIYPAPGVSAAELTLTLKVSGDTTGLAVPGLQEGRHGDGAETGGHPHLRSGRRQIPFASGDAA